MTAPHPFSLDDLWSLKTLGNIALSPDGRRVAFEIQSNEREQNESRCALFLLLLDEHGGALGEPRQLTSGKKHDTQPVWAPDSQRLLFASDRQDDKKQLWLIDTTGGEPQQLTNMLYGVSEAAWSPDGQWIAFTAPAGLGDDDELITGRRVLDEEAKKRFDEEEQTGLRTITRVWYRSDGQGLLEKYTQLFVMPAPATRNTPVDPATVRRLTTFEGDHVRPQWTPDSDEIGVLCNRNENRDRSFVQDLWAIERETGAVRCLTEGDLEIECYSWSPDGRMAMVAGSKDQIIHQRSLAQLYLVTRKGNVGDRVLAVSPDFGKYTFHVVGGKMGLPGPYRPQWSQDGQSVYFLASEHAETHVYRLDSVWRSITQITTIPSVSCFIALFPDEQGLLIAQERSDHPWELYRLPTSESEEVECLTHLYDGLMDEIRWGKVERFQYAGANDEQIEGWLLHPVGAREGVRYPLIVQIHGGPHWAFGVGIDPIAQYYAAHGYAVFSCNPHGSTSYGEGFMRSVLGDWGGQDYQDSMLGVDACIARGVADPERLLVTGYSYGGYMTMFVVGHTDRFKAAVAMAGISNLVSFVGTSDIGFWQAAESRGYPWEPDRAGYYQERSPLFSAGNIMTPTLLLHPENDLRCPIEQSEQFYMALKVMGKAPVEFIRVPGAWHGGTTKPGQYLTYWERLLAWFGKYVEIRRDEYD